MVEKKKGKRGEVTVETKKKNLERLKPHSVWADSRQLLVYAAMCQLTNESSYCILIGCQAYCTLNKMKLRTYSG